MFKKQKIVALLLLYVAMFGVHNFITELPAEIWACSIVVVCIIVTLKPATDERRI
jgi:hypothetical protein